MNKPQPDTSIMNALTQVMTGQALASLPVGSVAEKAWQDGQAFVDGYFYDAFAKTAGRRLFHDFGIGIWRYIFSNKKNYWDRRYQTELMIERLGEEMNLTPMTDQEFRQRFEEAFDAITKIENGPRAAWGERMLEVIDRVSNGVIKTASPYQCCFLFSIAARAHHYDQQRGEIFGAGHYAARHCKDVTRIFLKNTEMLFESVKQNDLLKQNAQCTEELFLLIQFWAARRRKQLHSVIKNLGDQNKKTLPIVSIMTNEQNIIEQTQQKTQSYFFPNQGFLLRRYVAFEPKDVWASLMLRSYIKHRLVLHDDKTASIIAQAVKNLNENDFSQITNDLIKFEKSYHQKRAIGDFDYYDDHDHFTQFFIDIETLDRLPLFSSIGEEILRRSPPDLQNRILDNPKSIFRKIPMGQALMEKRMIDEAIGEINADPGRAPNIDATQNQKGLEKELNGQPKQDEDVDGRAVIKPDDNGRRKKSGRRL